MLIVRLQELITRSLGRKDKVILSGLIFSVVLNLISWSALLFYFWGFTGYAIIGYNIYFGISSFGPWQMVLLLPLTGSLVILVNFLLALVLYLNYRVLSYILTVTTGLVNVIIVFVGAMLIYINF
jgi:hypothetical protein